MMPRERNHWDAVIVLLVCVTAFLCCQHMVHCVGENGYPGAHLLQVTE